MSRIGERRVIESRPVSVPVSERHFLLFCPERRFFLALADVASPAQCGAAQRKNCLDEALIVRLSLEKYFDFLRNAGVEKEGRRERHRNATIGVEYPSEVKPTLKIPSGAFCRLIRR